MKALAAARHSLLATTGAVLIAIFVLFALCAPLLAPQDPARIDLTARLARPNAAQ